MGGNALKNTFTRRYNKVEYTAAVEEIIKRLGGVSKFAREVPAYSDKESFGDLDIVVVFSGFQNHKAVVQALFSPDEIVTNSNVISFNYNDLQVDLLIQPDLETAIFTLNYFSYNDLGNFIGRTAHRLGFKFGHDGLRYVIRDEDNDARVVKELFVTKRFPAALEFLGFDPHKFQAGFRTKEEIFQYATETRFFDPPQFLLENRSCESRRRDRTRVMYQDMLKFLQKKYNLDPNAQKTPANKKIELERAFEVFPSFKHAYETAVSAHALDKAYKKNFNGENVSKWFGWEGKELGLMMKAFREYFEKHNLKPWIASLDPEAFEEIMSILLSSEKELWADNTPGK